MKGTNQETISQFVMNEHNFIECKIFWYELELSNQTREFLDALLLPIRAI